MKNRKSQHHGQLSLYLTIKRLFYFFLSGCIANLGVVPLVLFAAFRRVPQVLALRSLFVSVTAVLETISLLLSIIKPQFQKFMCGIKYLISSGQSVKVFFTFLLLSLILSAPNLSYSDEQELVISRGEHTELSIAQLKNFTIGNKDVLSVLWKKERNSLLIKGRGIGFSELIAWDTNGKKSSYKIYVLSKNRHLKLLSIAQEFVEIGMEASIISQGVIIEGEVENREQYQRLIPLLKTNELNLIRSFSIKNSLLRDLIGEIYQFLFENQISDVFCRPEREVIICHLGKSPVMSKEIGEHFRKNYLIEFFEKAIGEKKNYLVKLKIISVENGSNDKTDLGLSKVQSTLGELLKRSPERLLANNPIELSSLGLTLDTLATPETIMTTGHEAKIDIGADLPYTQIAANGQTETSWKFAGLKIRLKLEPYEQKLILNYHIELTSPSEEGSIAGTQKESILTLTPSKTQELFQLELNTTTFTEGLLSPFQNISILKKLFSSKERSTHHKSIIGVIYLEPSTN